MSSNDPSCDCRQKSVQRARMIGAAVAVVSTVFWAILLNNGFRPQAYFAHLFTCLGLMTIGIAPLFVPQKGTVRRLCIATIIIASAVFVFDLYILIF